MRISFSALTLGAMLCSTPVVACDLDGMYGNRFSAFSGAHRPLRLPATDDAGMPVNQAIRVPAPVQVIKSDLELRSAEVQPRPNLTAADGQKSSVIPEKVVVKAAVLTKR
jgi:hypothetical protein